MGAVLGSELATGARGRIAASASQNPVSCLQGNGLAAHTGCEMPRKATRAAFTGPQWTCVLICLPEQGPQRPSLQVEAGEAPGVAQEGGPESTPPFPEVGGDPTVLAPPTLPLLDRHPPRVLSQDTRATPCAAGQEPSAWGILKRHPSPLCGTSLGSLMNPALPCLPPLILASEKPACLGLWGSRGLLFLVIRQAEVPGLWLHICIFSACALQPAGTFRRPWAQLLKGQPLTSPCLLLSCPEPLGTLICLSFAYICILVGRALSTAEIQNVCCQIPNHVHNW